MMTLGEFKETAAKVTDSELQVACGFDYQTVGDPETVWLYDECLYITQNGDSFWTEIERRDWSGERAEIESRLYFEWYVSECIDKSDMSTTSLSILLDEWCLWSGNDPASADEILHALRGDNPPSKRDDIEWIEWFISTWESVQRREDRDTFGGRA